MAFRKPKDATKWWMAPHCGPGTTDANAICGFCGQTHQQCAVANTEEMRKHHRQACGGSGFWCLNPNCGRFWAQDSCGESGYGEERSADGVSLIMSDNGKKVFCVCDTFLFYVEPVDGED